MSRRILTLEHVTVHAGTAPVAAAVSPQPPVQIFMASVNGHAQAPIVLVRETKLVPVPCAVRASDAMTQLWTPVQQAA
jgi:hypothetical protein